MAYQFSFPTYDRPTVGLYIHIPFCVRKCDYCDFYSLANVGREGRKQFQIALLNWLSRCSVAAENRVVDTVYIGGGTPSCYDVNDLAEVIRRVGEWYHLAPDCEITVECNPDSATEHWLTAMKGAGVNRLSMGVQSANDDELRRVGRLHDFAGARKAFETARKVGFGNLSLDLIYGLPDQTMEDWQRSVETILALKPDHLSCYGLKIEEGTPLCARRNELVVADDDTQADMYLWMVERLAQAGYDQYEISNFARPGKHSRHNMRYWLGEEYLCAGPSAHGYFDGRRYAIPPNLAEFCHGEDRSQNEGKKIDADERVREYILLRLRTTWGVSAGEFEAKFGLDFAPLAHELDQFAAHGWAKQVADRWHFTPEGFLLSNALIGQLLDVLEEQLTE